MQSPLFMTVSKYILFFLCLCKLLKCYETGTQWTPAKQAG